MVIIRNIDFGLSKSYWDKNGQHIAENTVTKGPAPGTDEYLSVNAYKQKELTCRDDLESLGYVLMASLSGGLPWFGQKNLNTMQAKKLELNIKVRSFAVDLVFFFILPLNFSRAMIICLNSWHTFVVWDLKKNLIMTTWETYVWTNWVGLKSAFINSIGRIWEFQIFL